MRKPFYITGIAIFAAISIFICSSTTASSTSVNEINAKGINFIEEDWNKALSEAKKQNKLIFIDVYATWCGPCKQLKRTTFHDSTAGKFFNNNFINFTVNAEKGDGILLAKQYHVSGLPTLVVADKSGEAILYTQGFIDAKNLVEFGKAAIAKNNK